MGAENRLLQARMVKLKSELSLLCDSSWQSLEAEDDLHGELDDSSSEAEQERAAHRSPCTENSLLQARMVKMESQLSLLRDSSRQSLKAEEDLQSKLDESQREVEQERVARRSSCAENSLLQARMVKLESELSLL